MFEISKRLAFMLTHCLTFNLHIMSKLKIKVAKSGRINPQTKEVGYSARVITNGIADYDDIVANACRNTTLHKSEAKAAFELCMESVAELLKQGFIVDLGPSGKLYPSCTSKWVKLAEELKLSDVTPTLNFRPADDIAAAIKGATLQWVKDSAGKAEDDDDVVGDDSSATMPGGGDLSE